MDRKYKVFLLNESVVVDTVILFQILKKLTTPFDQTKAFELGIIDAEGKFLRPRKTLKTKEERRAATLFDVLIWNLKKILERLPFGKSRLASYAAAILLLREGNKAPESISLWIENFEDIFEAVLAHNPTQKSLLEFRDLLNTNDDRFMLLENAPIANTVGGGHIAGASPGEQPVVKLKKKKKKLLKRKPLYDEETLEKSTDTIKPN